MKNSLLLPSVFLSTLLGATCHTQAEAAAPPAACVVIHHDEARQSDGVTQKNIVASIPDGPSLHASEFHVQGVASGEQASELGDAASVLLLTAIAAHHSDACSDWLKNEGEAAKTALASGHNPSFKWSHLTINNQKLKITASSASFLLTRHDQGKARGEVALADVVVDGANAPKLLPQAAKATFSLPEDEIAALTQAVGGRSTAAPVAHVTIEALTARRDDITLSGNGTANLTGSPDSATASGHMEITNLNNLVSLAREEHQTKLATGLMIASLVSHKNNGIQSWDVVWKSGILTVNHLPIPLH